MSSRIFLSVVFLLFAGSLGAQTQQKLNIDAATVFLSGAELISSTKITLPKGETEVLFTNVAGDVNTQSLTINATNGVDRRVIDFSEQLPRIGGDIAEGTGDQGLY